MVILQNLQDKDGGLSLFCAPVKRPLYHSFINTLQRIKVKTTNDIRLHNQLVGKFLVTVIQQNILTTRHPFQKSGKALGTITLTILS